MAEVVLRLIRLWCWFDRMTEDGRMQGIGVTGVALKCGGDEAFWQSVQGVGWLKVRGKMVEIPLFSQRFGNSARRRLLTAKQVTLHRLNKKCNGEAVTDAFLYASQEPPPLSEPEPPSISEQEPVSEPQDSLVAEQPAGLRRPAEEEGEPETPQSNEPVILTFPTVGTPSKQWHLCECKYREYVDAFPDLDVLGEFRKALQWLRDHPQRRKTPKGMPGFLGAWLGRAQDRRREGGSSHEDPRGTLAAMERYLAGGS